MTRTSNRILDDIARVVTDAAGAVQGARREVETAVRTQIERLLADMDMARREDVDVLRDMLAGLREENARLAARVAALEAKGSSTGAAAAGSAGASGASSGLVE